MKRTWSVRLAIILVLSSLAFAQAKKPATSADFGRWESLARGGAYGGLSPDGRWLAYGINRSDRSSELRVVKLGDGSVKVAAFGMQPVFSPDSKWAAYAIGMSESDQDKLRAEKKPVRNKLGLLNLASGETAVIDDVESRLQPRRGLPGHGSLRSGGRDGFAGGERPGGRRRG